MPIRSDPDSTWAAFGAEGALVGTTLSNSAPTSRPKPGWADFDFGNAKLDGFFKTRRAQPNQVERLTSAASVESLSSFIDTHGKQLVRFEIDPYGRVAIALKLGFHSGKGRHDRQYVTFDQIQAVLPALTRLVRCLPAGPSTADELDGSDDDESAALEQDHANVYIDPKLVGYAERLVQAIQALDGSADAREGAASVEALCDAGRIAAVRNGRAYVVPEDLQSAAYDVLGDMEPVRRLAGARGGSPADIVRQCLGSVELP